MKAITTAMSNSTGCVQSVGIDDNPAGWCARALAAVQTRLNGAEDARARAAGRKVQRTGFLGLGRSYSHDPLWADRARELAELEAELEAEQDQVAQLDALRRAA